MNDPAISVTGLDHFVLRVRDLDRSIAFYQGVLGLPIESLEEYRAGTRPFASARVGGQLVDLVPDPTYEPDGGLRLGGLLHFCVRVGGDLERDVLPRLRAAAIEVIEDAPAIRLGATGFGRSIYVRDPDGYVVELKEDPTHA
jgi:catechol 2,3-dioxygenase-like lactoylglutathione lyase family enzyme